MRFDPAIVLFALLVIGFAWRSCETVVDSYAETP